jgi:hypothetical protein
MVAKFLQLFHMFDLLVGNIYDQNKPFNIEL